MAARRGVSGAGRGAPPDKDSAATLITNTRRSTWNKPLHSLISPDLASPIPMIRALG
ncbi:MAG: hypothetical protein V2I35_04965 [Desulfocapsaceae bacterium]|nr:hypothetical protein [Desulfocapsaceae bacterium]